MCKPGGGNNRCPIHQRGSIATLNTTTQLTGTPRDEATVIFKGLAAEGGNLQPPTPEMVHGFAETQRLSAKYNPALTNAAREKITSQWEMAKEETPSGGTFHAWKNTLSEVVRRQRSNIRVLGASLALSAVITGCGGSVKEAPTPPPSDGGGAVVVQPVDAVDYERNAEFGITLDDAEYTDQFGTYQRVTLDDDSPLLKYDESKVEESVFYAFTAEEIASGQDVVSRFAVEQTDSTLLWDDSDEAKQNWLDTNKPRFVDAYQEDVETTIWTPGDDYSYLVTNGNANEWREKAVGEPIYTPGEPRLAFTEAKLDSVTGFIDEHGVETLRYDYTFVTHEDAFDGKQSGVLVSYDQRAYAIQRDGNGGWEISGWAETSNRNAIAAEYYDPDVNYRDWVHPEASDGGGEETPAKEE